MHNAASLDNEQHKIILECYHPANKTTQPYLFCDFLGTPGLTDDSSSIYEDPAADNGGQFGHLGRLSNLFSRFRPIRPEVEARIFRTHPAGGLLPIRPNVFFESGNDESGGSSTIDGDEEGDKLVEHSVSLDADESFSQLCVVTSLVKLGPRRGVFARYVPVSDGVIRVWRDWLADRASERKAGENEPQPDSSGSTRQTSEDGERRVLWLDNRRNIGLKVKIKEKKWQRPDAPVLLHRDEEDIVCYSMEYEGS